MSLSDTHAAAARCGFRVLQAGMLPAGSRTWALLLSGARAADVELTIVSDIESDNTQVFSHFRYRDSCSGEEVR
jgi:hypothetical protein